MAEDLVYCDSCKFFAIPDYPPATAYPYHLDAKCTHPNNRSLISYTKNRQWAVDDPPVKINEDNDCSWYEADLPKL